MKFTVCIGIFTLILSASLVKGLPTSTSTFHEASLNKFLFDYLLLPNAADPAVTAACFAKYLPILTEIGNTYSTQYQACITEAKTETTALIDNASTNHTNFIATTSSICTAYQKCNTDADILEFFDCYAGVSSGDVSVLYTLSTNATSVAATLSSGIRLIQEERNQCINTTENTYVENTAATYKLLNECLGSADESTEGPATFAPVKTNEVEAVNQETFVVKTDCSTSSDTGNQIHDATGVGCQSQNSDSSSSSSRRQNQSGGGSL